MGIAYEKMEQYPEAVAAWEAAARMDPTGDTARVAARTLRGIVFTCMRIQNYADAIAGFRAIIAIEPNNADAYQGMGIAYAAMDKNREAIDSLDRAARLDPDGKVGREASEMATQLRTFLRSDR